VYTFPTMMRGGFMGAFAALLAAPLALAANPVTNYHPSPIELAYRAGEAAGGKSDAARAEYQRGIDMARAILRTSPDDPNALLWLAANLGGEALTHGKLRAFRAVPEIESTLLHLERVAPNYDYAAGARALANLYWKAPSIISVGSSKKASSYFQLALARAPDFPGNQAMAAAFYADKGDCTRARPLAQTVAARTDLDSYGPDADEWRGLARDALRDCR
jgi:tetratricopeptide (TPR) repeat protein